MVPKFAVTPLASDAVTPMTSGMLAAGAFNSRAQAPATAIVPMVPVECQLASRNSVGADRYIRPHTSAPMMKAERISDGDAPVVSATGRMAGTNPAIAWPAQ